MTRVKSKRHDEDGGGVYQVFEVTYAKVVEGTLNPYVFLKVGRVAFQKLVISCVLSTWIGSFEVQRNYY